MSDLKASVNELAAMYVKNSYYDNAEPYIDGQWEGRIRPFMGNVDFATTIDLAAGHGRNSKKLLEHAQKLWIVDVNQSNIDFCRKRFADESRIEYLVCDGTSLQPIPDQSVTLIYCFDSMVHFDMDVIRAYLAEAMRVLKPGGHAFLHHSNMDTNPTGKFTDAPGHRNFMTVPLMAHLAHKAGLKIVRQVELNWTPDKSVRDGFSLLRKP